MFLVSIVLRFLKRQASILVWILVLALVLGYRQMGTTLWPTITHWVSRAAEQGQQVTETWEVESLAERNAIHRGNFAQLLHERQRLAKQLEVLSHNSAQTAAELVRAKDRADRMYRAIGLGQYADTRTTVHAAELASQHQRGLQAELVKLRTAQQSLVAELQELDLNARQVWLALDEQSREVARLEACVEGRSAASAARSILDDLPNSPVGSGWSSLVIRDRD